MSKDEFKKLKTDELNSRTSLLRSATHQLPHRSRGVSERSDQLRKSRHRSIEQRSDRGGAGDAARRRCVTGIKA